MKPTGGGNHRKSELCYWMKGIYKELTVESYLMVKYWVSEIRDKTRMSALATSAVHSSRVTIR